MFRSFGLVALGLISLSGAAFAQPDTAPTTIAASQNAPRTIVQVDAGEITLNVHLQQADVTEALTTIATRGNLQLVIKNNVKATIPALSFSGKSPEEALSLVCEAAHLSAQLRGAVWIVTPIQSTSGRTDAPAQIDAIEFRQTEAGNILTMIAKEFNIPIVIDGHVKGEIPLIRLRHLTPREAIETVALAVDATVSQSKDGVLHIDAKPAT